MYNHYHYIIFGGNGDLARRKLLPALYRCEYQNQLPEKTSIIMTTRRSVDESSALLNPLKMILCRIFLEGCLNRNILSGLYYA